MKLHRQIQIEKVCSEDATRAVLLEPVLDLSDKSKPVLVATNGRALAVVPVEDCENDLAGYVSAAVLKAGRKAVPAKAPAFFALSENSAQIPGGIIMPRNGQAPIDGNFPNYKAVIPQDPKARRLHLDPEQLYALAQAIGSGNGVTLEFNDSEDGKGQAVIVRPCKHGKYSSHQNRPAAPDAFGVLMTVIPE